MNNYYFTADKWYGPYNGESGYKVFLLPSGPSSIPEFAGMVKEEGKDFRLFNTDKWYWCKCEKCGWEDSSQYAGGGFPIADTGDYNDATCPVCGSTKLEGDTTVTIPEQFTGIWAVKMPIPRKTAVPVAEEWKQTFSTEGRPEIANAALKRAYADIETSGEFRSTWVDGYCQALRDFNIGT